MCEISPHLNGTAPSAPSLRVLRALESAGLEAWYVGGWVRDALMGRPSHDVDMCCSGTWRENAAALERAGIGVVESGIKFGGITAVCEGERVEVTTWRSDGFYTDGRHPDSVERVSTLAEDLARRDFTVNALAWHPERGLVDEHGGVDDIKNRVIRAVGEPRRRFEEDALRMLRAVRFACRLDFKIEPITAEALAACAPLLDSVARERVGWELDGILRTGRGGDAMLRYPELVCAAVPELKASVGFEQHSIYHDYNVYDHIARVLTVAGELALDGEGGSIDGSPSPTLMWAAFLHDVAKPQCFSQDERGRGHFYGHPAAGEKLTRKIMERLGLSHDLVRDVCLLIRDHDKPLTGTRTELLEQMRAFSGQGRDVPHLMDELLYLRRADTLGKAPSCFYYVDMLEEMRVRVHGLIASGEAYSLSSLDLAGGDLIAAGVAPGPQIGRLLAQALDACIAGEVPNKRDLLLAYVLEASQVDHK